MRSNSACIISLAGYLLVYAELEFIGLIGLLTMLLSNVVVGLKAMRRSVWNETSELVIGTLATVIVVSVHMAFEWLFITNYVHYLLAMNLVTLVGITAGLEQPSGKSITTQQSITAPDFGSNRLT